MLKIWFLTFLLLSSILPFQRVKCQGSFNTSNFITIKNSNQSDSNSVYTPYGLTRKNNVHYIDKNHILNINKEKVQVICIESGTVSQEYKLQKLNDLITKDNFVFSEAKSINGWITFAWCSIYYLNPDPINYFSTRWIVPSPPKESAGQVLFLFNGLVGFDSVYSHIVQPVLQWGVSAAGGGPYWAICNWYATKNKTFCDSLIVVNPGDTLKGIIQLTGKSGNGFNYYSSFEKYSHISGLQVNNLPELTNPYEALEAYNVNDCSEYPIDEKIRMFDIHIMNNSVYLPLSWQVINKDISCGQFTEVVNGDSKNGMVEIHFHTPYSIDNFDEIHIYPNPVNNYLHISPDKSLNNCRIEIYDTYGKLMQNWFYKFLDYEFNISFENYEPGQYYIKFYYDNKTHTFKIIKYR